jgi:hypothetical protein
MAGKKRGASVAQMRTPNGVYGVLPEERGRTPSAAWASSFCAPSVAPKVCQCEHEQVTHRGWETLCTSVGES